LTLAGQGYSVPRMARKDLTTFLIALNDSVKLRDRWRDPEKRAKLLEQWGLSEHPALQEDSTIEDMRVAVEAEGGLKQVDLWIRTAGAPEPNPEYDVEA
jgi:hypothetical protein